MRSNGLGLSLFAIAAASFGVLSIIYSDFAPMWQSIWSSFPGRMICVYGSAFALFGAGAALCFSRIAPPSALTIGAYYAVWAVASVPAILSEPFSIGSWYGVCEAATSLAAVWILYVRLHFHSPAATPGASERGVRAARVVFGATCLFYGWSHWAYADYTASFVPVWLPGRLGLAYFTGLAHIAAGLGVMLGILPRLAATLEAVMMSLFGLLVWIPTFFAHVRPSWAGTPKNQWTELAVNLGMAASAWIVAESLRNHPWSLRWRSTAPIGS